MNAFQRKVRELQLAGKTTNLSKEVMDELRELYDEASAHQISQLTKTETDRGRHWRDYFRDNQ